MIKPQTAAGKAWNLYMREEVRRVNSARGLMNTLRQIQFEAGRATDPAAKAEILATEEYVHARLAELEAEHAQKQPAAAALTARPSTPLPVRKLS